MTTRNDAALIAYLASAVVHLLEHIDTNELTDLETAKGLLAMYPVQQWVRHNHALIPVRRDGKEFGK